MTRTAPDVSNPLIRPTSRRTFLAVSAGTVFAFLALREAPRASANDAPMGDLEPTDHSASIAGVVTSSSDTEVVVRTDAAQAVSIMPSAGARLYSGIFGRVAGPGAFVIGDEIGDHGWIAGDHFVAKRIGSIFNVVDFDVTAVDRARNVALTDIGALDLSSMNLPDVGLVGLGAEEITAGQRLNGTVWTHPTSGIRYLAAASLE